MARGELHYRWEWCLEAGPEALWPFVADTNRFNRETGAPKVELLAVEGGRRVLRLRTPGGGIPYEEAPFEWARPERFGVERRYGRGPLRSLRVLVELRARPAGGTELRYETWAAPRGLLGRALVPIVIGRVARARFDAAFRRYDGMARGAIGGRAEPPPLEPGGALRLASARERLTGQGVRVALADRLVEAVRTEDELAVSRIRPYALADRWAEPRRDVLELCLHATRAGLLESRWETVCPHCRGAVAEAGSLAGVRREARCEACEIDFGIRLDRQLELVFRPGAAIRDARPVSYCVGGPGLTPHIVLQQRLVPAERRAVRLRLEPGAYRIRATGVPGAQELTVGGGGPAERSVAVRADGWQPGPVWVASRATVELVNDTGEPVVVVAERTAWADDAATAADVTALQAFRDLFAAEALRPGEELSVGSLTIVFTDLRDSTRLYREIGDAPAFGSVSGHFDVLREEVAGEGGTVVKTIGDAVLAVFRRPVSAVRSMAAAQRRLAAPGADRPLQLKVGVHCGPCIAVTLNDRLDYFGSTVNAAARMVGLSTGSDLVLSGAVCDDPEVAAYLEEMHAGPTPVEAKLKGFDDERFELWRVTLP